MLAVLHSIIFAILLLAAVVWLEAVIELRMLVHAGSWRPYIHHFYFGVALIWLPGPWWLWVVGLVIALDDAWQHYRQRKEPTYLSPLHYAYEVVYGWLPKAVQHAVDQW